MLNEEQSESVSYSDVLDRVFGRKHRQVLTKEQKIQRIANLLGPIRRELEKETAHTKRWRRFWCYLSQQVRKGLRKVQHQASDVTHRD